MKTQNELNHTEKIQFIFDKLLIYLNPKETDKYRGWTNMLTHPSKRWEVIASECDFTNAQIIKSPFNDISLQISEDLISIEGNDFEYAFEPHFILTIAKRFKKIKEMK